MTLWRGDPRQTDFRPVDPIWMDNESVSAVEEDVLPKVAKYVKERALLPDSQLTSLAQKGENFINEVRKSLGLSGVDHQEFLYSLLSSEDFNQAITWLTNGTVSGGDLMATQIDELEGVLLKDSREEMLCTKVGILVHEWVHHFIDRKVHVIPSTHGDDPYKVSESRRSGVAISRVPSFERDGELLNEMGNFVLQIEFTNYVLETEEGLSLEKRIRDDRIARMSPVQSRPDLFGFDGHTSDGRTMSGVMLKKNIHFDAGGEWSTQIDYLTAQLADDLAGLIDGENPGTFRGLLLRCKVYPEEQGELRKLVDGAIGRGFFFRLKRAKYYPEDLMILLNEVQKRLYPDIVK